MEELITIVDGGEKDAEIDLFTAFLEDNGIEVWQDQRSNFPTAYTVAVIKVRASEAGKAIKLLEEYKKAVPNMQELDAIQGEPEEVDWGTDDLTLLKL